MMRCTDDMPSFSPIVQRTQATFVSVYSCDDWYVIDRWINWQLNQSSPRSRTKSHLFLNPALLTFVIFAASVIVYIPKQSVHSVANLSTRNWTTVRAWILFHVPLSKLINLSNHCCLCCLN